LITETVRGFGKRGDMKSFDVMLFGLVVSTGLGVDAAGVSAQVQASERGTVSQVVDGTTITVDFGRPVARGRAVFGALVPYGQMWTPGANQSTTLAVDADFRLNGHAVAEGRYSVWSIPGESEWTIVLSRDADLFHTRRPRASTEAARFTVRPEAGPHREALTWWFPLFTRVGAQLEVAWSDVRVPLRIAVPATSSRDLEPEDRGVYGGTYALTGPDGASLGSVEVVEADGRLSATVSSGGAAGGQSAVFGVAELPASFRLAQAAQHRFHPALYAGDRPVDAFPDVMFSFETRDGCAVGVEVRRASGELLAAGAPR
jgi:hypothetical protein